MECILPMYNCMYPVTLHLPYPHPRVFTRGTLQQQQQLEQLPAHLAPITESVAPAVTFMSLTNK